MNYEFIYTFVIDGYTESKKINLYWILDKWNIKGFFFKTNKGFRVITIGATRRKVEGLMLETKGKHLRILDDFTYQILQDYITSRKADNIK